LIENISNETYFKEEIQTTNPLIVNNIDFYKNINILDFIRNYGVYFRMSSMLSRDSV